METSLIISLVSLIVSTTISSVALFIAYRTPHMTEEIKSKKRARQEHFNKIKQRCLIPILQGITNIQHNFQVSEMTLYNKKSLIDSEAERGSDISYFKLWVSLTNNSWGVDPPFERILFDDLPNHFPDLAKEIDKVQKFLDENFPVYRTKFNELIIKLFYVLEESNLTQKDENTISRSVTVALLYMFIPDQMYWPNLYRSSSKDGTLDILKKLTDQAELTEVASYLREISDKSNSLLSNLRTSIDKTVKFEGELKGNCIFLE